MQAQDIISSIHKIYEKFKIPPNLQEHMLRVSAVGKLICENWTGPKINKKNIIAVLLIHDLGNIAKFNFEHPKTAQFLGSESKNIEYWKSVKKEMMNKYGRNDHEVTKNMVKELGISKELQELLSKMTFIEGNDTTLQDMNFEIKIASYSDMRIGPFGVLSLQDRLKEFKKRRKLMNKPIDAHFESMLKAAMDIEKQIMKHLTISKEDINDKSINPFLER